METGRIKIFKELKQFMYDNGDSKVFNEKYPNYDTWVSLNFKDSTSLETCYDKLRNIGFIDSGFTIEQFYTKTACDLEWAKESVYCTSAKSQQKPVTQQKKGDPAVLKLQQDLVNKGYFLGTSGPNKDGVDGVYGLKTKNAEEAFKKGIDYKTYNAQFFQSSDTNKGNTTQGPDIDKKVNLGPGKTMTNTAGTQGGTTSGTQGSAPQKGRVIKTINPNDW